MNINKIYFTFIALGITFCSCSSPKTKSLAAPHITFVKGSGNNKFEVLDWGGNGKPILFLAGLGNTAHIFNDFAPKFTYKFHVYGLTRRGFGASSQPKTGYDFKTLTTDILTVIDSLHIDKVILIGHSIAGQELSKFASTYPDRVDKIIYLDAAYDYTSNTYKKFAASIPPFPKPTTADSSSIGHLNQFYQKTYGLLMPEDELRQTCIFSKKGKYLRDVTPDSISGAMMKNVEHPDYIHITCPAMVVFAEAHSIKKLVPFYSTVDAVTKRKFDNYFNLVKIFQSEEEVRFKKEVLHGTVNTIVDAKHYIFISNPTQTEKMIREFLQ